MINQKFHYFSTKALSMRHQNKMEDSFHNVELKKSNILSTGFIDYKDWSKEIIDNINTIDITKNFRQKDIINQWNILKLDKLPFIELELTVSSGFFVRQFVRDLSIQLD